jgi:hypothetical protein
MNQKQLDLFLTAVIDKFREYQKEWLTSHNDIEFKKPIEDLIVAFIEDTADGFIQEYTE